MERKRSNQQLALLWVAMAAALLLSPSLVISSSLTFEDQKNFFYTTPPTTVLHTPPPPTPTPSYHGDGGGTPPANCGGHPSTPTGHGGGYSSHSPPLTVTPPTITMPSPPNYDPNSPPFTCTYWKNHPNLIWGLWNALGATNVPGFGANRNLVEALSNTRTDGFGELYREGTAALLNSISMAPHENFPYTTTQVKDRFVRALASNKAAAAQARLFKLANQGTNINSRV